MAGIFEAIMEHSLLTMVLIVDVFLIGAIVVYVLLRLYETKRPDRAVKLFLQRLTAKRSFSKSESIEGLYKYVINTYVHKGVVKDGVGFNARRKILDETEGREREVVKKVFDSYECKVYGGGLQNETSRVEYLFNEFNSL